MRIQSLRVGPGVGKEGVVSARMCRRGRRNRGHRVMALVWCSFCADLAPPYVNLRATLALGASFPGGLEEVLIEATGSSLPPFSDFGFRVQSARYKQTTLPAITADVAPLTKWNSIDQTRSNHSR